MSDRMKQFRTEEGVNDPVTGQVMRFSQCSEVTEKAILFTGICIELKN